MLSSLPVLSRPECREGGPHPGILMKEKSVRFFPDCGTIPPAGSYQPYESKPGRVLGNPFGAEYAGGLRLGRRRTRVNPSSNRYIGRQSGRDHLSLSGKLHSYLYFYEC